MERGLHVKMTDPRRQRGVSASGGGKEANMNKGGQLDALHSGLLKRRSGGLGNAQGYKKKGRGEKIEETGVD